MGVGSLQNSPGIVLLDIGAGVDACPWDYAPDYNMRVPEASEECRLTNVSGDSVDVHGMKKVRHTTASEGQPLVIDYRVANVKHPVCSAGAVTGKGYWIALGPSGGFIITEPLEMKAGAIKVDKVKGV